jgi:hypothetical protein
MLNTEINTWITKKEEIKAYRIPQAKEYTH